MIGISRRSLCVLFTLTTIFFRQPISAQEAGEQESHDDPAARARWRLHQRADVNGEIPPNALIKAKEQMDRLRLAVPKVRTTMDAGVSDWEWLGPGNIGGRIRSITINPVTPQIMYVGSVGGGIWRTDNGGIAWYPLSDFMANLAVTSIVIDPTNPATLYAATGEGFGNVDAIQGAGIFKSTDAGLTWNQIVSTATNAFKYTN
jgi:hypothetical protein